jgi:hypothetical protein
MDEVTEIMYLLGHTEKVRDPWLLPGLILWSGDLSAENVQIMYREGTDYMQRTYRWCTESATLNR